MSNKGMGGPRIPVLGQSMGPAKGSGIVDLGAMKARSDPQGVHHWVMSVNFDVDPEVMATLARGGKPDTLDLGPNTLRSMEGPGCAKCGAFWSSEIGLGKGCPVVEDMPVIDRGEGEAEAEGEASE